MMSIIKCLGVIMMCGFTGIFNKSGLKKSTDKLMNKMLKSIEHRGPDDEGIWLDAEAGICFGFRRLAILDLTPQGHQPMISKCGRWVMVYNGEIYNHLEIKKELEEINHNQVWRGHSDTEVLLEAIVTYGVNEALKKCVGMFAIALWDRSERTLTLARDRVGEKPLYYGWVKNNFVFSSELSSFFQHPEWDGNISRDALTLLMRHNYIPAPFSIFDNISKLQPANIIKLNTITMDFHQETYWSGFDSVLNGIRNPFEGTHEESIQETERLLRQSLKGQMHADVPLGAFLSGGIDSTTVSALMQNMSSSSINTFSIGFNEEGYNEAVHAKACAQYLGTNHTELYVTPKEAQDIIPLLPSIYSEPFADSSQIPTFLVSKLASNSVTVALSGDGGDELFSGYTRYTFGESIWNKIRRIPHPVRCLGGKVIQTLSPKQWNWLVSGRIKYNNPGEKLHKLSEILALENELDIYKKLVSHWESPESLILGSKEPVTSFSSMEDSEINSFTRLMMYKDLISYLPDDILVKVDRASMARSIEVRVPMLDHRLIEFSASLPMSILRHQRVSKWPLREILYKYVPKSLVERPKMGFGIPIADWLRGPLKVWSQDLLDSARLKNEGYFDSNLVSDVLENHLKGRGNNQYKLWNILMFQSWLENYQQNIHR